MEQHINIIAALNIIFGTIKLLIGLILLGILMTGGLVADDPGAFALTTIIGIIIALFFAVKSLPEIIGGLGLLKRKLWARILIIILGCLDLIEFPIGSAIGIYTLWVLLNEETVAIFNYEEIEHG
jgi:hypothetical protein